ncbi:MAG: carbonate dehydratase [Hyphomicrobiales bacterium]|nr:carbonate dehydratase [Hyphomicrobiales bacterium]
MSALQHILERNAAWSHERTLADPEFFSRLARIQTPELLWIGCSDSRVPANQVAGLEPGEVFVHRNVANLVYPADINCMAVVQYAVESLKVKHIVVCGHYGCGGVRAALKGEGYGLIDHWLEPVKDLARQRRAEIDALPGSNDRINHLCELNVRAQVHNLTHSPIVQRAWEAGQNLTLHGWIYGLDDGRLHDLGCDCHNPNKATPKI